MDTTTMRISKTRIMKAHHSSEMTALFLGLLLLLGRLVGARTGHGRYGDYGVAVTEHNLGKTCEDNETCPNDKWGLDLLIDLYRPIPDDPRGRRFFVPSHLRGRRHLSENDEEEPPPFLIMACGGNADKSHYSRYATALARRGYSIAVMNKTLMMALPPPAPSQSLMRLNAITPVDFNRVIDFVRSNSESLGTNDASSVVLLGHSYGGAMVLSALHGFCSSFFCGMGPPSTSLSDESFPVELSSSVIGAFAYGASIYQVGFPGEPRDDRLTNVNDQANEAIPIFLFWGEHEKAVDEKRDGDYIFSSTWGLQEEPRAYAVGEGMDHDSLANEGFSTRNIFNSTLPREIQIQRAVTVTDEWIQYLISPHTLKSRNFCLRLGIPIWRNEMSDQHKRECGLEFGFLDTIQNESFP